MCMVVYIGSNEPLPLIPWRDDAPAFNVEALSEFTECVRTHFSRLNIRYAGSHTSCGCGFNEGRDYYDIEFGDPKERVAALRSSVQLVEYIRAHQVDQVYSCWSGDEDKPQEHAREIAPEALLKEDFVFRERELLTLIHKPG